MIKNYLLGKAVCLYVMDSRGNQSSPFLISPFKASPLPGHEKIIRRLLVRKRHNSSGD